MQLEGQRDNWISEKLKELKKSQKNHRVGLKEPNKNQKNHRVGIKEPKKDLKKT